MARLTGGQALVAGLIVHGVDTIFALPGVQLDHAFDALYAERHRVRVIHTRHEQATAYMADGYARSTGKVGVCLVVPGPGVLNTMAALSTAYACNSPVLCLTGQIRSDLIGVGRGVLHEIPNQLVAMAAVTKHAARVMSAPEIPGAVVEAFRQLRTGRPRPVELEIPPDVLAAQFDAVAGVPAVPAPLALDPRMVEAAALALAGAERPLIFAGGGVLGAGAWTELRELAEAVQAPVVMTQNGLGAISARHPLALPPAAGKLLVGRADVILAVGTRFAQPPDWGLAASVTLIHLDVDGEEIGRNAPATVALQADARAGLAALRASLPAGERPSRAATAAAARAHVQDLAFEVQPQYDYARALRAAIPEDGLLVNELTQVGYFSWNAYPVYEPRTYLGSGYQGTLGFGLPTSLGAKIGNPSRKVVSINGDGGFLYNVQELSTMRRHNIAVAAVVFNDDAFGNVRRIQEQQFGGRTIASDLANPDFGLLAKSFGLATARATTPAELQGVLTDALATDEPVIIEVPVGPMPSPWGFMNLPLTREWW